MTSTKSVVLCALCFLVAGVAAQSAQAQTFKVLYAFTGGADGGQPYAGVVLDASGNLYGTTAGGGRGSGVVFELTPTSGGWSESTLHSFTGGPDGGIPVDALIFDAAGNLYGTTNVGGVSCGHNGGCGVAFELSPDSGNWVETVLYSFQGGIDGYYPVAGLVFDKGGHLYSTVENGGSGNSGMVYELTNDTGGWQEKILYSFNGSGTGVAPEAAPILDARGNLFGTTSCCSSGGAVWELLHGTWKEKTLYSFSSGGGYSPWAGLVFDKAGNLYGTTTQGGGKNGKGRGVVFKLAKSKGGDGRRPHCMSSRVEATGNSLTAPRSSTRLGTSTAQRSKMASTAAARCSN
jgi:hypothetical protein